MVVVSYTLAVLPVIWGRGLTANARLWWGLGAILVTLASVFLLFLWGLQEIVSLRLDYTLRTVSLGGALLGMICGILGCFAVLRQQSLLGDALAHAALPGVALAFLLSGRDLSALLIGAALSGWLGMQFIQTLTSTTRIKQDAALGIVLSAWFALGILLLAYAQNRPDASQAGLDTFIFGQAASIVVDDLRWMLLLGALLLTTLVVFWNPLKAITYDAAFAATVGLNVRILQLMLTTLIVITIVLGLQLAGVILMVGLLIAPGVAARQWVRTLAQMALLAGGFGAFAGAMGACISALDADIPTGPTIVVVTVVLLLLSLAFAPERGLIWRWRRQQQDRRAFLAEHLLRDLRRYALGHGDATHHTPQSFLLGIHGKLALACLKQLRQQGLTETLALADGSGENGWCLTANGLVAAESAEEERSLWEHYRLYGDELQLPPLIEEASRLRSRLSVDDWQRLLEDWRARGDRGTV